MTNIAAFFVLKGLSKIEKSQRGVPVPSKEKQELTWQNRLSEYCVKLETWSGDADLTSEDYFHEKCILFLELLDVVPDGGARTRATDDYIAFLTDSPMQRNKPAEWLVHFYDLLKRANEMPAADKEHLMQTLNGSANPVILMYTTMNNSASKSLLQAKQP